MTRRSALSKDKGPHFRKRRSASMEKAEGPGIAFPSGRFSRRVLDPGVPKSTLSPGRFIQCGNLAPLNRHRVRDHHLGYAIAMSNMKGCGAVVDQDHLNLATIVGVNRTRCVEKSHMKAPGQAASRPNLRFGPPRKGNGYAGGDDGDRAGIQGERRRKAGMQIHSRRSRGLAPRENGVRPKLDNWNPHPRQIGPRLDHDEVRQVLNADVHFRSTRTSSGLDAGETEVIRHTQRAREEAP